MMVAKPGSPGPLTPEQRAKKPPVPQPIFRRHPITGRRVLYRNPGYAMWIDGMDPTESDEMLDFLFRHQARSTSTPSLDGGRRADVGQYRHRSTTRSATTPRTSPATCGGCR